MKTFKDFDLTEATWSAPYQIFFVSDTGKGNVKGTLKGKAKNASDATNQAHKALEKEADKVEKDKKIAKKHGAVEVDDAHLGKISIKEHNVTAPTPVDDGAGGVHDISDPEVLKRVNAFVGSIADREYLNANHAISELRQKLMRIGVTFGAVEIYEGEGDISVPLQQWSGRYGKDGNQAPDEVINDDGISHRVDGGLSLNFKYMELDNGSCKVLAKIA